MKAIRSIFLVILFCGMGIGFGHPIDDYYKIYKDDPGVEARVVPPKMAALLVEEEYVEAIELLKSMTALKYLNYTGGDQVRVKSYVDLAKKAKGNYQLLLEKIDGSRTVSVFGTKNKGTVRNIFAVVETQTQFLLMIGKGKLTDEQINYLPELSKEL
ncbi:MAG: DUF4252 domain-containing protein [Crocinitomix sp.]|nr:DUF4252 domain-containing protein [Crocinitomix sp.]